ncbi:MAG: GH92 family glycosyl hydrolase [Flavobacterium sp.]|nr:GH92 family glycosyl hydrolase [Flavobacterium sp.]
MKYFQILFFVTASALAQNYQQYVNPFIGTGGHGHTFPGATTPFGMVQLSPDTRIDGSWDGCSGYHYSDNVIYGFSHTHLNGTGVSDFGDIMLMPTMGEPVLDEKEYSSSFSHKNEKASAGFYSVKLDKHNIDVALTTSTRVGFHEYKFNKSGQANIILDLNHRDLLLMGEVRIIDNQTIEVMRNSSGWAQNQFVYARIEFSEPLIITKAHSNSVAPAKTTDRFFAGNLLAISFSKQVKKGDRIMVKVALSPTGTAGAKLNISEIPHWDFGLVKKQAQELWNTELRKIEITEKDKNKLSIFYTALYHTMIQPNIAQDIDGKYRGRDEQIHTAEGFDYYTVFSLWDTFRAAHPLYTIIDKKRTSDFVNTFLKQYEQGGRLPVWELASNETDCMIGYHSVSVIADAMAKGIKGFDYEIAFEAAKNSAMLNHLGLDAYKMNGFISIDDEHESVSKTLEYAYDDWCIAQMAAMLNKTDEYQYFMERSQSWKNIFDPSVGFMRPKKNGGWDKPFDAREVNNNFTEGNSWQYSFFVPQDIPGMIAAYGGPEKFEQKLDEMFTLPSKTTGREQVDITGLIGQYAHGNEPSHHITYLYNFVGKPEKTVDRVGYILNEFYKNSPDGLIGNEDCGQMSAWYVLSSLGIYSVTPGQPHWSTAKPYFRSAKINYEDGTSQTITSSVSEKNLRSIGKFANATFETPTYNSILPVPVIESASKAFRDQLIISIQSTSGSAVYYMLTDHKHIAAKPAYQLYTSPIAISESSNISAYAELNGQKSNVVSSSFYKKPNDYSITLLSTYNPQYHAGGPEGLIDGIAGDENWRKGDWQGYQGQDFECVIDLKESKELTSFYANFLQDSRSWILMPTQVEFYISNDNKNFRLLKSVSSTITPQDYKTQTSQYIHKSTPVEARYVKVKAKNFGKLPDWHQGHGGDAFIFIDEISVR